MRAPLLLPISIALLAAFPALAQDAPRVLFCSGPCFAVDANGVRTPAPKGTVLRPNQRFETGAGGYAQIKLAPDTAMALGDSARVRIDQTRLQEPMIVNLDLGRARMLLREVGKPIRPIELHTVDGRFLLRDADVEIKKSQIAAVGSNVTVVKVNAGDAMLRAPQGDISVGKRDVQGIVAGKVIPQPIPRTEIALTPSPVRTVTALPQPVATIPLPDIALAPSLRGELAVAPTVRRLPPTVTAPLPGTIADAPIRPVLTTGELVPYTPVITSTGEVKPLTTYLLTDPLLTTTSLTTTKSLELVDTSTSLSTSSLSSINLTTTTSTSLTDTTVTKISTSPTLVTTTTTTTSTLSPTSPITTINTSPIILQPITFGR